MPRSRALRCPRVGIGCLNVDVRSEDDVLTPSIHFRCRATSPTKEPNTLPLTPSCIASRWTPVVPTSRPCTGNAFSRAVVWRTRTVQTTVNPQYDNAPPPSPSSHLTNGARRCVCRPTELFKHADTDSTGWWMPLSRSCTVSSRLYLHLTPTPERHNETQSSIWILF